MLGMLNFLLTQLEFILSIKSNALTKKMYTRRIQLDFESYFIKFGNISLHSSASHVPPCAYALGGFCAWVQLEPFKTVFPTRDLPECLFKHM